MTPIRLFSCLGTATFVFCGCHSSVEEKSDSSNNLSFQPNILWITCEDITPSLGCYGDSVAQTPNLDQLAEEGVRFNHAYSISGVSAPSRCALITGMYPTSIGGHHQRTTRNIVDTLPDYSIVPPPEVKCFTEYLRQAGYFCTNNHKTDYQFDVPVTAWDENGTVAHWKHRPSGKPFFSVFNLVITHESQQWTNGWYRLLTLPEEVNVPPYYPDHPKVRYDIARKYSNISLMDGEVGVLLDQLRNENLLDSTIVVFFSDHGGPLPRQKRELYESGTRAPLIIRFPDGRWAGSVNNDLVSFVDFAPTMLSLAGIEPPAHLQGKAFLGQYKQTSRDYVFAARDRMDEEYDMVRAVRGKRFRYLKNYQPDKPFVQDLDYRKKVSMMNLLYRYDSLDLLKGHAALWWRDSKPPEELYDLENDPYELNNLADSSAYQNKLIELRKQLTSWQKRFGDKGFIPEKKMIRQMWGGEKQPVTRPVRFKEVNGELMLDSQTKGASIAYQVGDEDDHWALYDGPLSLDALTDKKIKAVAIRIGYAQSEIKTVQY